MKEPTCAEEEFGTLENQEFEEICCANCNMPASDWSLATGNDLPSGFYSKWYCSESCYDEDTQHEG